MSLAVLAHVAVGSVALALYWTVLLARKGSRLHRRAGKVCLGLLVLTGLSVGPLLLLRAGPFDPGYVVQMTYLTACLATVSKLALDAIRFKTQAEQFRGRLFRTSGPVLLVLGLVVLTAGLLERDPVAVVLSWVGVVYGIAMITFARYRGPLHPRWWMSWHLNAVTGLFNAVNGTFLYVAARWAGIVSEGPGAQVSFQLLTIAGAVVLRLWFGLKFRAPLRFSAATAMRRGAAGAPQV
ncbi:MAG: hypothetical protein IPK13_28145 [Deltaproteobacteria bacterium]|nr:hypothetical protein [Deltaproteobacteria bacterium]